MEHNNPIPVAVGAQKTSLSKDQKDQKAQEISAAPKKKKNQEIKENLYEYLNLPEFNISVPSHYHAFINDICDFEEKGSFILMGMVKSIKRGKGWSRVEVLDYITKDDVKVLEIGCGTGKTLNLIKNQKIQVFYLHPVTKKLCVHNLARRSATVHRMLA